MTALLAILLQVGPPAPCVEPERLPFGTPAQCAGGFLAPRRVIEAYVAGPRICAVKLKAAADVADARVKACSEGVELLHAAIGGVVAVFEAGQVEGTERLIEAETRVCPWYECPGWSGVGLAFGMGATLAVLNPWAGDPQWTKGGVVLAGAGVLWWVLR